MTLMTDALLAVAGAEGITLPTLLSSRRNFDLPKDLCVRNTFLEAAAPEGDEGTPWAVGRRLRGAKTWTCPQHMCFAPSEDAQCSDAQCSDSQQRQESELESRESTFDASSCSGGSESSRPSTPTAAGIDFSTEAREEEFRAAAPSQAARQAAAPVAEAAPQRVEAVLSEAPAVEAAAMFQAPHFFPAPACGGVVVPGMMVPMGMPGIPGMPFIVAPMQIGCTAPAAAMEVHWPMPAMEAPLPMPPARPPPAAELKRSSAALPSVGSKAHFDGQCKPCGFYRSKGCEKGKGCNFCHLCDPMDGKSRRKAKQELAQSIRKSKLLAFAGIADPSAASAAAARGAAAAAQARK